MVLKVNNVLILTVIYYINQQLVIGGLVLKVKQVLILTVLKAKFDCISTWIRTQDCNCQAATKAEALREEGKATKKMPTLKGFQDHISWR